MITFTSETSASGRLRGDGPSLKHRCTRYIAMRFDGPIDWSLRDRRVTALTIISLDYRSGDSVTPSRSRLALKTCKRGKKEKHNSIRRVLGILRLITRELFATREVVER